MKNNISDITTINDVPQKGATTITPSTSAQTIAAGTYLTGVQTIAGDTNLISNNIKSGVNIFGVSGNSNVVDTSAGDATAAQILSGKKAYVDGKLITGTIASQGAQTITPGTSNKTIASGKYLSGTQTIAGDANLVAGNIKKGTSIFGITGTYNPSISSIHTSVTIANGSTATIPRTTLVANALMYKGGTYYTYNIGSGQYMVHPNWYYSNYSYYCGIVAASDSTFTIRNKSGVSVDIYYSYVPSGLKTASITIENGATVTIPRTALLEHSLADVFADTDGGRYMNLFGRINGSSWGGDVGTLVLTGISSTEYTISNTSGYKFILYYSYFG